MENTFYANLRCLFNKRIWYNLVLPPLWVSVRYLSTVTQSLNIEQSPQTTLAIPELGSTMFTHEYVNHATTNI